MISAERLVAWELCERRYQWMNRYPTRVSLVGALYRALDAGLKTEGTPETAAQNELLAIASNPGLDITGGDVYPIAIHHAWLVGVIAQALRNAFTAPWLSFPDSSIGNPTLGVYSWRSGLYDAGDGIPRRVALVDRWSDDRKASEARGWRTTGEAVALGRAVAVTAIEIGSSHSKRRVSPWTRCYRHPKNDTFRFRRVNSEEDFSRTWKPEWREDSGIPTAEWLARMQHDGCLDSVHTMNVPPPARPEEFIAQMCRIAREMEQGEKQVEPLAMRLSGCYDVLRGECPFIRVCPGKASASSRLTTLDTVASK